MKNRRVHWSEPLTELLIETYPHIPTQWLASVLKISIQAVYNKALSLGLTKTAEFMASEFGTRLRRGDQICAATRFRKGQTPWNKGKHYVAGGRSADTRFTKGNQSGRARQLYQPIGSERLSKDGYLQRKINDDMPLQRRWRGVHIINWEAINGPLPHGHALIFKDGNKQNTDPENLELVTRAELMRRNSCHRYGKEIAQLVQLRGALTRKINSIERKQHGQ
jgi:hypothetical protein